MTLRARLAVLTSVAVALAVLAATVAAWLLLRSTLLDEVDQQLLRPLGNAERVALQLNEADTDQVRVFMQLSGDPISVRQLGPDGSVMAYVAGDGTVQSEAPPGAGTARLAPGERRLLDGETEEPQLATVTIDDTRYRTVSVPLSDGTVLQIMQSLEGVERTMTRMAWLLVGLASAGVAAAGGLGWLIARAGLRPVNRLAGAAERVAATKDLAHRVEVTSNRRDEVARLASSMNAMLAALDGARIQQRQLVENAGHELRTPLATLRNDIGVLRRAERHPERTLDPTDRAHLLRDLETEATALSDLVAELVELARGNAEPEPLLETELRALADRAVARTRRVNPRVEVTVRGASFEAFVRPATLERAVANLVRNAAQVSPDGGLVEVELTEAAGQATVAVRDRGPGIAEHDLPRLFDRFYRGEGARERHGSGLGLAIVAQAVEQHRGTVDAANRTGGGAVFTVRVPVRQPAST